MTDLQQLTILSELGYLEHSLGLDNTKRLTTTEGDGTGDYWYVLKSGVTFEEAQVKLTELRSL